MSGTGKYGKTSFPATADSVAEWLDAIGLGQFKERFESAGVTDLAQIPNVTGQNLDDMNITVAGHRKRFQMAVQALDVSKLQGGANTTTAPEPKKKFNSTSSLYIESTMAKPCVEEIIFCVSVVLFDRIQEGEESENKEAGAASKLFPMIDFQSKPLFPFLDKVSSEAEMKEDHLYHTIRQIYEVAQFSCECLLTSLIYIERIRQFNGIPLLLENWQPILLASMIVAQKVWDDKSLLNVDFSVICPAYNVKEINKMEKVFLELIDYSVSVTQSTYAAYYFELRTLCEKAEKQFNLKPLSEEDAKRLATNSERREKDLQNERRFKSMGAIGAKA